MRTERQISFVNGFPCYRAEPESNDLSFAHVLNIQPSEEGWLADATELFLPEYFARQSVGEDYVYRQSGEVAEHVRDELYRQACVPGQVTLESMWRANHMLYCYERDGSFAKNLNGDPFERELICPDTWTNDGSDNENVDTLNSELLLTEEYLGPVAMCGWCGETDCHGSNDGACRDKPVTSPAPDKISEVISGLTSSPQRPVRAISLIEQED